MLRALTLVGLGGIWAVACGGPQELAGAGTVCFRADDCKAGLFCVPVKVGAAESRCSADLSNIVSMVDGAPAEAAAALGGASGSAAGGASGATVTYSGSGGTPSTGGTAAGGISSAGTAGAGAGGGGAGGPNDAGNE